MPKRTKHDSTESFTQAEGPAFPWHTKSLAECFQELALVETILTTGLTSSEAARRLAQYGPNRLQGKEKVTLLQRIWNLVANVLVGILVFVAIVSAIRAATAAETDTIISNWIQVGLIVFVITLNTCIGIYQEGSAEKAAEALQNMLSSDAVVLRDGKESILAASDLVPGDIVHLSVGESIPADLRMCQVRNLASLEAALTGESVPIDKMTDVIPIQDGEDPFRIAIGDRHNMCYSATLVAQGSGVGLVVATGDNTEIGTINALVNKVEKKKTNVLKQIDTVSKYLAIFITLASGGTWFVAFFITGMDGIDALTASLVCAVAMIPEGLEAIVTMTYGWAVSNMAKKNAIIRALPAVETLGSVTTVCSDKTGTLTKNEMSLVAFVTSDTRYRFNVHATDRTTTNFVADQHFMAKRASHAKYTKRQDIIASGPSANRKTQRGRAKSFPFGISAIGFGKSKHHDDNAEGDRNAPDEAHIHEVGHLNVPISAELTVGVEETTGQYPDETFLRQALCGGILCSKCVLGEAGGQDGEIGNPTELSILRAAYFGGVDTVEVKRSAPIVAEVPFSSEYKFMATVHKPVDANDTGDYMDKLIVHIKGAPDRLIPLCKFQAKNGSIRKAELEPCDTDYWIEQIAILSSHGLRVLALTRGTFDQDLVEDQLGPEFVLNDGEPWLTMVGLCAIMDPLRPECVQAVHEAHTAGVRIIMITGDHKDTALAIGGMLGLLDKQHTEAITGPELDEMTDDQLALECQRYNIFARSSPQNKIQIVKALQSMNEICGMTGDGVNDAPALKAADMGVAMGKEGTDVAREAAEMILADDNFATIVTAIREGRVVWDNLRKVLLVNTPINNAQGMSVLFGLLLGLDQSPLSSIQVLYSNLICAVTLGFVTAVEPAEEGIMEKPPRRIGKHLIGRFLLLRIFIGTSTLITLILSSVFWVRGLGYDVEQQHAQALNVLNFGAVSITMSARFARNPSFHWRSLHGNAFAWWSYCIMAVLQIFITYTPGVNSTIFSQAPMDLSQWGIVGLFMFCAFVVMETEKSVRNYLTDLKYDTGDEEYGIFDTIPETDKTPLPKEIDRFHHNQMRK